jgi:chemotaxis response regulator CheB
MRVMVLNQSEQLRQVLQYVLEQGVPVDIVGETNDLQKLVQQVNRLQPDWLFLLQEESHRLKGMINRLFDMHPMLQIILLSADGQHVRFQQDQHGRTELDRWPEYTLSDFIYAMKEVSPSPAAVKSIEDVGKAEPPKFIEQDSGR